PAACEIDLDAMRRHAKSETARLPDPIRDIMPAQTPYPVEVSQALSLYQKTVAAEMTGKPRDSIS
ncbi:MAG: hypothetical protein ACOC79_00930, partial [Thermodesulfobacteriota bacterium]